MQKYFITSTGTGIGKTFVTTLLCRKLCAEGKTVHALKPVISGWEDGGDNDTTQILASLDLPATEENIEKTSLYRLKAPLSPDIAACMEGVTLDFQQIVDFCTPPLDIDYLIIEGIGGIMTPITHNKVVLDLLVELNMDVMLISGCYLGTISHTLTSIESMYNRGINIKQVIINQFDTSNGVAMDDIVTSLKNFTDLSVTTLPYMTTNLPIEL